MLCIFFYLSTIGLSAQQYYPLHPSIGDTLERIEKLDYALFPKVKNPDLVYCLIDFKDNGYRLLAFYQGNEQPKEHSLSQKEIIEAQQIIEKINAFYRRKAKTDSLEAKKALYPNRPSGKTPTYTQGVMSERAKKEARMFIRLQEDRRRMEQQQRGIQPNRMHIEFK
ncbi:MAG: hypothetical protein RIC95_07025 [Vicingaceae bacterium]